MFTSLTKFFFNTNGETMRNGRVQKWSTPTLIARLKVIHSQLVGGTTMANHGNGQTLLQSLSGTAPLAFHQRCPWRPKRLRQACTSVLGRGNLDKLCSSNFRRSNFAQELGGMRVLLSTKLSASRVSSGFDQMAVSRPAEQRSKCSKVEASQSNNM